MPFFDQICNAALHYNYKTLTDLFKKGAFIDEHKGIWTPAGLLASKGYQGPVEFLISFGANPSKGAMGAAAAGNFCFAEALADKHQIPFPWIAQGAGLGGQEYKINDDDLAIYLIGLAHGGHETLFEKYFQKLNDPEILEEFHLDLIKATMIYGHFKMKDKVISLLSNPSFTPDELKSIEIHSLLRASDEEFKKKYESSNKNLQYEMSLLSLIFNDNENYLETYLKKYPQTFLDDIIPTLEVLIKQGNHVFLEKLFNEYPIILTYMDEIISSMIDCGNFIFLEKMNLKYKISLEFNFDQMRLLQARFPTQTLLFNSLKMVEDLDVCGKIISHMPDNKKLLDNTINISFKRSYLNVNQMYAYAHPEIQILLRTDIIKNKMTPTLFCLLLTFIYPMNFEDTKGVMGFFHRQRDDKLTQSLLLTNNKISHPKPS